MTPELDLIDFIVARFRAKLWVKGRQAISARHAGIIVPRHFVNDAIACCVIGATQYDSRKLPCTVRDKAIQRVQDALDDIAISRGFCSIEACNDDPSTTLDDILSALKDARQRLLEQYHARLPSHSHW